MPKMKTNKAMAKRFRVTGTGKIRFNHQNLRHCLGNHRSRRNKMRLKGAGYLVLGDQQRIERGLPYGGIL